MTDTLTAPLFWLTAGDPGPFPPPVEEPCCGSGCCYGAEPGAGPVPPALEIDGWDIPGLPRPEPDVAPVVQDLAAALDALAAHGPLSGSRADTAALFDLAERARAAALRELAEMDAAGVTCGLGSGAPPPRGCATSST